MEFSTEKEAAEAIRTMNETDYEGRTLFIREVKKENLENIKKKPYKTNLNPIEKSPRF